ncbi:MAG: ANTH-domain-containing [Lasallia pustulata]|uniref:ANTH-domain-containing n=1 Tax=Lasallia pustulata TaxID=136370 RepID=A0A5M8PKY7_9LECA|nr:MAG: ANTH-domain-containing [Lasallia pustulata]
MSSSFEKSVKGGTKVKLAAPKSKYVEHILVATHAGEAGVAEIFRALQNRLRDSTWTIVFKSLIIVHLMVREGEPNVTLKYLAESPSKLAVSNFSDAQPQGSNIRHYYSYVLSRAKAYRDTELDWVREGQGRLKRQTIDKGLLRETEIVQSQIAALVKCDLLSAEPENEISLTAFRLLTMDLLVLYHVMNEGTINVLEHYFEMSKYDAERALAIYKVFSKQTNQVVEFLSLARQYESSTRLEIPKLKHAPTSLTTSLEEYLNDPDFEINRRQYLAHQDAKKGRKPNSNGAKEIPDGLKKPTQDKGSASQSFPESKPAQTASAQQQPRGPAPDLIDFFASIEDNQQPMAAQSSQQQMPSFQQPSQFQQQQSNYPYQQSFAPSQQQGFVSQPTQPQQQYNGNFGNSNPFGQIQSQRPQQTLQTDFTGAGFGGYGQQPQQQQFGSQQIPFSSTPQELPASFPQRQQPFSTGQQPQELPASVLQQQSSSTGQQTNPFRQSTMATGTPNSSPFTGSSPVRSPSTRQSTNPFAKNVSSQFTGQPQASSFTGQSSPFSSPPPVSTAQSPPAQSLQSMPTGTNPFARNVPPPQPQQPSASPLAPNSTGSTNPFRQSMFMNQQTGKGWQQSQQATMGGLEQLDTVPVFPRPGQQQQQTQQQPWL